MKADHRALADLAASVADGNPVDWQGIESKSRRCRASARAPPPPGREHRVALSQHSRRRRCQEFASAPRRRPSPTGPRWGRLVMLDQIGHGSSGDVLRAWDSELHREVALKLLTGAGSPAGSTKDTHAKVLQEARRLARVRHAARRRRSTAPRSTTGASGCGWSSSAANRSSRSSPRRGPFGAAEAAVIGQDLCAALAAVHEAGLLHRDVKAQNVLRESGGRTVLMDFGTGEELRRNTELRGWPERRSTSRRRSSAGKPASVESDLYSLGRAALLPRHRPIPGGGRSLEQLAQAHTRNVSADGSAICGPICRPRSWPCVERALDPDPAVALPHGR